MVGLARRKDTLLEDLKTLVDATVLGNVPVHDENIIQTDYSGMDRLMFTEVAYRQKEALTQALWSHREDIQTHIALKTVADRLMALVRYLKQNAVEPDTGTLAGFFSDLENEYPLEDWEVFHPLYGVNPLKGAPLTLGPFTIYQWPSHQDIIKRRYAEQYAKYPDGDDSSALWHLVNRSPQRTIISVHVQTRDPAAAVELSVGRFHQFANTVRFMIGGYDGLFDVGIVDYRRAELRNTVALSATRTMESGHVYGAIVPVDLENPHFTDRTMGNDVIWDLLTKGALPDLHRRILSAVEWGGKAAHDSDPVQAFVQCMFGFETLFTFQEKGVLVSPSVASQIAELTAFVLETNVNARRDIYRRVSAMYGQRSGVAHGGSMAISREAAQDVLILLRKVVAALLTSSDLRQLQTMTALRQWVEHQKFS